MSEQVPFPLGANSWAEVVARIEELAAATRRSPEVQREQNWYRARHAIDIDNVLSTPEGRLGFHAGMLYVRCQQESET